MPILAWGIEMMMQFIHTPPASSRLRGEVPEQSEGGEGPSARPLTRHFAAHHDAALAPPSPRKRGEAGALFCSGMAVMRHRPARLSSSRLRGEVPEQSEGGEGCFSRPLTWRFAAHQDAALTPPSPRKRGEAGASIGKGEVTP